MKYAELFLQNITFELNIDNKRESNVHFVGIGNKTQT